MVQLWAELDVAGVRLVFAHLMAVVSQCVWMLDLMRVDTLFCGPRLLACESASDKPLRLGVGNVTLSHDQSFGKVIIS